MRADDLIYGCTSEDPCQHTDDFDDFDDTDDTDPDTARAYGTFLRAAAAPAAAVETTVNALECDVVDILSAIKRVKLGIDKKSALPILQGVHIKDGRLTTTDLETTVSTCIDAAGKLDIVAPIALLEKVLGKLSGGIVLTRDGLELQVTELAGSRTYSVTSWAPEDYPLESIDPRSFPCIPRVPGWRDAWSQVKHAIGKDPTRIGLTRVSVDGRTVVTTDSYRMVVHTLPAEHVELPKVLICGRACEIVEKLKGAVSFGIVDVERPLFSVFGADGVTTVSTLPRDETYPNWQVLLPAPGAETMSASVDRKILLGAIAAVSVVAGKKDARVDLAFSSLDDGLHHERALKVSMTAAGIGSAAETIGFAGDVHHCRCEDPGCTQDHGATWRTAFSPAYLAEGLEIFSAGRVALQFSSPLRPLVMRDENDAGSTLYLLMPIRAEREDDRRARVDAENGARNLGSTAARETKHARPAQFRDAGPYQDRHDSAVAARASANATSARLGAGQTQAERERDYSLAS